MRTRFALLFSLTALILGSALFLLDSAKAGEPTVKAGIMRCDVAGGVSFIFGSTKKLSCIYSPGGNYPSERYSGEIEKFGVDIGYTESGVIIWAVMAPTANVARGALRGTYVGASADIVAGAGLGANALFGSNRSIALQPLSFTGSRGINIAAGLSHVELAPEG